jgi:hypothetical protein
MESTERLIVFAVIFVLIFAGIFFFLYFYDQITGSKIVSSIVAGMLYLIPLGTITTVLSGGGAAIPA